MTDTSQAAARREAALEWREAFYGARNYGQPILAKLVEDAFVAGADWAAAQQQPVADSEVEAMIETSFLEALEVYHDAVRLCDPRRYAENTFADYGAAPWEKNSRIAEERVGVIAVLKLLQGKIRAALLRRLSAPQEDAALRARLEQVEARVEIWKAQAGRDQERLRDLGLNPTSALDRTKPWDKRSLIEQADTVRDQLIATIEAHKPVGENPTVSVGYLAAANICGVLWSLRNAIPQQNAERSEIADDLERNAEDAHESGDHDFAELMTEAAAALRSTPKVEVTEKMVEAAMRASSDYHERESYGQVFDPDVHRGAMRVAIEAALAASEEKDDG